MLRWDGSAWQLIWSETGENHLDQFGSSVAISGDGSKFAVGAPGFNSNNGKARIYTTTASVEAHGEVNSNFLVAEQFS